MAISLENRLLARISLNKTTTCWDWTGTISNKGYGRIRVDGRHVAAHRVVYEWCRGKIPKGLPLDHLCRNRSCVNPDHLEPVTDKENILRGIGQGRKMPRNPSAFVGTGFLMTTVASVFVGNAAKYGRRQPITEQQMP